MKISRSKVALLAVVLGLAAPSVQAGPRGKHPNWNDSRIEWKSYAEGMQSIKILGKPGLLVFYTDWCPHCQRYAKVFHDSEVVELSKHFVMIRVDRDQEKAVNQEYARSGGYVPRTLFLNPRGKVVWKARSRRSDYPYFLDERNPAELVALMRRQAR